MRPLLRKFADAVKLKDDKPEAESEFSGMEDEAPAAEEAMPSAHAIKLSKALLLLKDIPNVSNLYNQLHAKVPADKEAPPDTKTLLKDHRAYQQALAYKAQCERHALALTEKLTQMQKDLDKCKSDLDAANQQVQEAGALAEKAYLAVSPSPSQKTDDPPPKDGPKNDNGDLDQLVTAGAAKVADQQSPDATIAEVIMKLTQSVSQRSSSGSSAPSGPVLKARTVPKADIEMPDDKEKKPSRSRSRSREIIDDRGKRDKDCRTSAMSPGPPSCCRPQVVSASCYW